MCYSPPPSPDLSTILPMAINPFTVPFDVPAHEGVSITAVYTNLSASADAWIDRVEPSLAASKEKVVGTDLEFTPPGRRQKAAVIQLCVGQDCLVYHICCAADPVSEKFKKFLRNRRYKFAAVAITQDIKMMSKSEHHLEIPISNHIDIQLIWANPDSTKRRQGMKDLAAALIHDSYKEMKDKMISKDHEEWAIAPLSEKHMHYAAKDAYVSYELYRRLDFFERGWYHAHRRSGKVRSRTW